MRRKSIAERSAPVLFIVPAAAVVEVIQTMSSSQTPIDPTSNNASEQQHQPRPLQMGAKGAYIVRLLMVGDSSCGKTSLVLRFDQNVFSTKFVTTIGVDYRDKMVKVSFHIHCRLCSTSIRLTNNRIFIPSPLYFLHPTISLWPVGLGWNMFVN